LEHIDREDAIAVEPHDSQAVLTSLTEAAIFIIATVESGSEPAARDLLADVSGLTRTVGFRVPDADLTCVVGIGSLLWDRLFGVPRPAGLHPFREIAGDRYTAVASPGDLLFHLRARRFDACFELADLIVTRLEGHASVVDEVHGFKYFDERDLLGFVDGTENPSGRPAFTAAIVGGEDPEFAGGSYVITQKYVHDLKAWAELSVEEQQLAVGRTKLDNVELADDVKPVNSHVALNTIADDQGEERQIVRFNMPFGRVGADEHGTFFIGYTRAPDVIERMLTNMFVGDPPGNTDRLLDFSTALTGNLFFVPTSDFLDDPPPLSSAPAPAATAASGATSTHGSLGIGSLKGIES
jgi:putative iron-dependent peroxidase